jgi:hypothetical protein
MASVPVTEAAASFFIRVLISCPVTGSVTIMTRNDAISNSFFRVAD